MIQLEGRALPPEKIMFKNLCHSAGPEADWSRHAVKEHVISAVSGEPLSQCTGVGSTSLRPLGCVFVILSPYVLLPWSLWTGSIP